MNTERGCVFKGCETDGEGAVGIPTIFGVVWLCQNCRDKVLVAAVHK
jgi:hypothetical protein